ncbi:MAG TPA: hypothetical protein VGB35_04535 [Gammaproteobacteria bacterium]
MPECYSQRMLNPFHGIVNVVEIEGADAVCSDGENWTLFVHGTREVAEMADGRRHEVETTEVKYGVWSRREGLKRAPVRNAADYEFVDHIGRYLIEVIRLHARRMPFPLRDHYELWLLDSAFDLPLALIESRCRHTETADDLPLTWRAGVRARSHFKVPETLARRLGGGNPAEAVERVVNRAAGARPRAQWFLRKSDRSGQALRGIRTEAELAQRNLPAEAFPEQQLRSHWPDRGDEQLVRAYLDWQAPWLLMLQHLSDPTRDRLEQAAVQRAMLMAESHVLFPKVIDSGRIVAARVEASLRRAAGEEMESCPEADALFPFFNE